MPDLFNANFFQRTDESTRCYTQIKLMESGNYDNSLGSCVMSDHGRSLEIEANIGYEYRKVFLTHLFSVDYSILKNDIIDTADVKKWIKEKD